MPEDFNRDLWSRLSHNKTRHRAGASPELDLSNCIPDRLQTPSFYHDSTLHSFPISESGDSIRGKGKSSLKVKVKNLGKNCVKNFRPRSAHAPEGRFDVSQLPGSNAPSRYEPSLFSNTPEQTEIIHRPFSERGKGMEDRLSHWETSVDDSRSECSKAKSGLTVDECEEVSEADQMRETIRALHFAANKIASHRKPIHFEVVSSIDPLPPLQLSPTQPATLLGDPLASAPSIIPKADATPWHDGHTRNKNNLRVFIRQDMLSPEETPSSVSTNRSATFSPCDIEDGPNGDQDTDDNDSICTLSDGEPDYYSIPFSPPTWPALPTSLHGPFACR